jgi:hypothetical protein
MKAVINWISKTIIPCNNPKTLMLATKQIIKTTTAIISNIMILVCPRSSLKILAQSAIPSAIIKEKILPPLNIVSLNLLRRYLSYFLSKDITKIIPATIPIIFITSKNMSPFVLFPKYLIDNKGYILYTSPISCLTD